MPDFNNEDYIKESQKTFKRLETERQQHIQHWTPIIEGLGDVEFAGILFAVGKERDRRLAELNENPFIQQVKMIQEQQKRNGGATGHF